MFATGIHSFAMYMGYNYLNGEAPPTGLEGTWCAEANEAVHFDGKTDNYTYKLCIDYDKSTWRREDAVPEGTRI